LKDSVKAKQTELDDKVSLYTQREE